MKRIKNQQCNALVVSDFSAVGRCSLTAALPILSALGVCPCAVPTALLSSQTGGISDYSFLDLSDQFPLFQKHWKSLGLSFDGAFTGYFAGKQQIEAITEFLSAFPTPLLVVDPIMADGGKFYDGFDQTFVQAIKPLCAKADVLLPNLTEACFLTDTPYRADADQSFCESLCKKLLALGAKSVVLKGYDAGGKLGMMVADQNGTTQITAKRIDGFYHGAGDVFGAVLYGYLLGGASLCSAAKKATKFTTRAIHCTHASGADTRFGLQFERILPRLLK